MAGIRLWYQSYVDEENGRNYWVYLRAHLARLVDDGTKVEIHGITPHDSYPHPLMEWRCAREMIANAIRAEREGYDAVVVGHFQDAGLHEARSAVGIPVLGLGETTMLNACMLGERVGIVSLKHGYEPWFRRQIRTYGLESRIAGPFNLDVRPEVQAAAWTDADARTALFDGLRAQMRPIVAAGVEVLVPSGGGPMSLLSAMGDVDGAPVVDGTAITVKTAEMMVKLGRLNGLSTSRAGAFRRAPPDVVEQFLTHPKGL
jgi:Asp/Glu/hydantoin racemase